MAGAGPAGPGLVGGHVLVAGETEIGPRLSQQVGVLPAVRLVAGQTGAALERFVDRRFLELGMEIPVAGEADVGSLLLEQAPVGGLVAGVAPHAVAGLERVVGYIALRDSHRIRVAAFALGPAAGTHQRFEFRAVGVVARKALGLVIGRVPVSPFRFGPNRVTPDA